LVVSASSTSLPLSNVVQLKPAPVSVRMPGMDGLALLKQIKQRHPMLPVIIMTAHSDLDAEHPAFWW
jgi:DNA-binding NtrC family response regulator